ncbi:MAG: hypothetical protein WEB89_08700 [Balneolales bacterium]
MAQEKNKPTGKFTAFDEAVSYGAMYDKLNIKNIVFWTVLGISVLLIVVMGVISLYKYNKFRFQESASIESEFPNYQRMRVAEDVQLNTYGVVDEESGIYHIPVDSAMTLIINDNE